MTVSKSWFSSTWQKHRHDILIERRRIRKTLPLAGQKTNFGK
jgi:hypothetical protein